MINLTINNQLIKIKEGSTLLQAIEKLGIEVPKFCFHQRLLIAGNCRICLVEVNNSPKPVVACAIPVNPGIVVYTNTPLVKKARENVLELLLTNHPLDCPICDQGGECDLQDLTIDHASDRSRSFDFKRSVGNKNLGNLIKTVISRCIHCSRCIRFCTEIAGSPLLGITGRGNHAEVNLYTKKKVETNIVNLLNSPLSSNIIDLCPVGFITNYKF